MRREVTVEPFPKLHVENESCRLSGRHVGLYSIVQHRRVNTTEPVETSLSTRIKGQYWGKEDAESGDSCVRVTPYCSLGGVDYDISCGGRTRDPYFVASIIGWPLKGRQRREGIP